MLSVFAGIVNRISPEIFDVPRGPARIDEKIAE